MCGVIGQRLRMREASVVNCAQVLVEALNGGSSNIGDGSLRSCAAMRVRDPCSLRLRIAYSRRTTFCLGHPSMCDLLHGRTSPEEVATGLFEAVRVC